MLGIHSKFLDNEELELYGRISLPVFEEEILKEEFFVPDPISDIDAIHSLLDSL